MSVHYSDDSVTLHHGDCIDVMRELPDNSVDAVVTDPPYGLEFMGKEWDRIGDIGKASHQGFTDGTGFKGFRLPTGYNASANLKCLTCGKWRFDHVGRKCECGPDAVWPNVRAQQGRAMQEWHQEWATEALRVLKPGGHLVAFGGSRTYHRMTCALEDAGFEVRDSLMWLYGSGFPKSHNVGKAIDRAAGKLPPESVGLTVAGRTDKNLPNPTVKGYTPPPPATPEAAQWDGWGTALKPAYEPVVLARKPLAGSVAANVLAYGTGGLNVDGCRIGTEQRVNSGMANLGVMHDDAWVPGDVSSTATGRWPANVVLDPEAAAMLDAQSGVSRSNVRTPTGRDTRGVPNTDSQAVTRFHDTQEREHADSGGASRYFYTAKAGQSERPAVDGVAHPTVKPLDLMQWLIRLVTPPGGVVLEPFAGSGTTAEACVIEGFRCIAIEREADYLPLIVQRLSKPIEVTLL